MLSFQHVLHTPENKMGGRKSDSCFKVKKATLAEDASFPSPGNGGSRKEWTAEMTIRQGWFFLGPGDSDVSSPRTHPPPGQVLGTPTLYWNGALCQELFPRKVSFRTVRVQNPRGSVLFGDIT